jgi:hypothetical protein
MEIEACAGFAGDMEEVDAGRQPPPPPADTTAADAPGTVLCIVRAWPQVAVGGSKVLYKP